MQFVTLTEAAARLGKTERTLWRWVADKKVETQRQGNKILIGVDDTDTVRDTILKIASVTDSQMDLRDREFEANGRLLSVVEELNVTLRSELQASRLSSRALTVFAFVLLVVMAVGGYMHRDILSDTDTAHSDQLTTIASQYDHQLLEADGRASELVRHAEVLTSELEASETARQDAEDRAEAQRAFGKLLATVFKHEPSR